MTTGPSLSHQPPASEEMCTQNDDDNTIRTPSVLDSSQIQKVDLENGEKHAQNDAKRAEKPAKKGGPKTKKGEEVAVRNNTKHGVLSRNPVLPRIERKRDWEAHLAGVVEGLQPEGHLERLDRYVTAVTEDNIENPRPEDDANTIAFDKLAANLEGVIGNMNELLALPGDDYPAPAPEHPEPVEGCGAPPLTPRDSSPLPPQRPYAAAEAAWCFSPRYGTPPSPTPGPTTLSTNLHVIPHTRELQKIIRYEAHLHRLIDKTLRTLEALQAKRLGHKVYHVRHL